MGYINVHTKVCHKWLFNFLHIQYNITYSCNMDICFLSTVIVQLSFTACLYQYLLFLWFLLPRHPTGLHESVLIQIIDLFQKNNRYDGQTVVFGDEFQKKLGNLKYFLVRKNTSYISVLVIVSLQTKCHGCLFSHFVRDIFSHLFYVHCIHM